MVDKHKYAYVQTTHGTNYGMFNLRVHAKTHECAYRENSACQWFMILLRYGGWWRINTHIKPKRVLPILVVLQYHAWTNVCVMRTLEQMCECVFRMFLLLRHTIFVVPFKIGLFRKIIAVGFHLVRLVGGLLTQLVDGTRLLIQFVVSCRHQNWLK